MLLLQPFACSSAPTDGAPDPQHCCCFAVTQGLPLLLGSFGTLTVLLFGKPDADSVRPWPLIAGQLGSMVIALLVLGVFGAGLLQRAVAMGAAVAYMMWADCIHPPGGELSSQQQGAAAA
jgi:CBS-domain-containing membrane protein